jgi:hypothetical protein
MRWPRRWRNARWLHAAGAVPWAVSLAVPLAVPRAVPRAVPLGCPPGCPGRAPSIGGCGSPRYPPATRHPATPRHTQVRYRDARYSAHPNAHPCRHPPRNGTASRRRPCRLPCRPRRPRKNEKLIVRSSIKATRSRRRRTPRLHHGRSSIGCAGAQRSSAVRTASGPRLSSRGWDVEGLAGRGARRARRTGGGPRRRSVSSRGSA